MIAVIDARNVNSSRKVWGMPVLERTLHLLKEQAVADIFVVTEHRMPWKHKDIEAKAHVTVVSNTTPDAILEEQLSASGGAAILLEGDVLYDRRVIAALAKSDVSCVLTSGEIGAGVFYPSDLPKLPPQGNRTVADRVKSVDGVRAMTVHDLDPYLASLRHNVIPHMIRIDGPDGVAAAEQELFRLSYKGGLDFIYQFIYKQIVRILMRFFCATPITPNQVTLTYLAIAVTAMPFLAMGHTGTGLLICLAAMIGDAADGVLARITFQTSKLGHRLDKHSHRIYHSLWYVAAAIGLSGGDYRSPVFWNGFALVAIYLLSRQVTGHFKDRFQISIFDITPADRAFRYVSGARWNVNMLILAMGVLTKHPVRAFYIMTAWGLIAMTVWILRHFTAQVPEPKKTV